VLKEKHRWLNAESNVLPYVAYWGVIVGALAIAALPLMGASQKFRAPDDLALRIRLADTLTSTDSQTGDPFSATVVDKGDYQNARVGHTSMMLRFDRW